MNRVAKIAALALLLPAVPCLGQGKPAKATSRPAPKVDVFQDLLNQADAAIAKENYPAAIEALEKYTAGRPEEAYGFFQLGYAHTGQKNWTLAKQAYEKAISLDPKMGAAHLNMGLITLDHGDAKDAVTPLRRAAELLPERTQVQFLLGTALERSGKTVEAIACYQAAIQKEPGNAEFHLALGRAMLNSGQHSEAQRSFEAALKIRPDAAPARLGLAQSLMAQKQWEAASKELSNYLQQVGDDSVTRLQLAHVFLEMGSAEKALAELDRIESATASSPGALKLRVDIYLQMKRLNDAMPLIEKLLVTEPEDADLHATLGRLYLEKRQFAQAEKQLVAALRIRPALTDALRDLASTYYLAENYPAALKTQDLLMLREPSSTFFWFVRATCFDKLGMKPQALENYQKFVALDQGRSDKQDFQARQRVKVLQRELEKKK